MAGSGKWRGACTAATLALVLGSDGLARGAPPAALEPLSFLLGEWVTTGAPGQATGTASFARGLQERVILRTSFAEYPASPAGGASRHDDLLVIYTAGEGVRADYFDSEGHVIRYAVGTPSAGRAVFLSDPLPNEPRYRLSYLLGHAGELRGEFAIAAAGKPEAFQPYLSWESVRAAPREGGPRR
jgi:hypothetical protein